MISDLLDPPDFRFRLVGAHIRDNIGIPLVDKTMREMVTHSESYRNSLNAHLECLKSGKPEYSESDLVTWAGVTKTWRMAVMPLADKEDRLTHALACVVFDGHR